MLEHVEGLAFLGVRLAADLLVLGQAVGRELAAAHRAPAFARRAAGGRR